MLYPRITRQTIGLVLVSLVFLVSAIGIAFIVYFFHTSRGNLLENLREQWSHTSGRQQSASGTSDIRYTHYLANDFGGQFHHKPSQHRQHPNDWKPLQRGGLDNGLNSHPDQPKGVRATSSTSDTIYIDDYDRATADGGSVSMAPPAVPAEVTGSALDIDVTSIEYFDQIIMDHTGGLVNPMSSDWTDEIKTDLGATSKKNINANRGSDGAAAVLPGKQQKNLHSGWNKIRQSPRIIQTKADIENASQDFVTSDDTYADSLDDDDDDDDEDDDDNVSSGSGDFPIDIPSPPSRPESRHKGPNMRSQSRTQSQRPATKPKLNNNKKPLAPGTTKVTSEPQLQQLQPHQHRPVRLDDASTDITNIMLMVLPGVDERRQQPHPVQPVAQSHHLGGYSHLNGALLETRARRILGNVKKSEERSRQLLLCEEAGVGELCRMLFKGQPYD